MGPRAPDGHLMATASVWWVSWWVVAPVRQRCDCKVLVASTGNPETRPIQTQTTGTTGTHRGNRDNTQDDCNRQHRDNRLHRHHRPGSDAMRRRPPPPRVSCRHALLRHNLLRSVACCAPLPQQAAPQCDAERGPQQEQVRPGVPGRRRDKRDDRWGLNI